jgi:hypothetical protein
LRKHETFLKFVSLNPPEKTQMKKHSLKSILAGMLVFIFLHSVSAQTTITAEDCAKLRQSLNSENWLYLYKESSKLLKSAELDTSDFRAEVLYMNLISAAGMVTIGQMTFNLLQKNIMKYEGQKIICSMRPVTMFDGKFGEIKLFASENSYEAFASITNSKKVNILSFEKFVIKDKIDIYEYQQSNIHCGGILEKIETNPSHSITWVLRLTVKDAFVRKV